MKTWLKPFTTAAALYAAPAMAHVGPTGADQHFAQHLLIALALGIPLMFGLLRLLRRARSSRR
jgi:hypothetical protein